MDIESNVYKNQTVVFKETKVSFNGNGASTVNDELGKYILKNFKNVWVKGKKPREIKKKDETSTANSEILKLKQEIERLLGVITDKDKKIQEAKNSESIWREEFEKLSKLKGVEPENKDDNFVIPEGMNELYEEMKQKNYPSLKKWVKDELNIGEDILEKLTTKNSLIKFVFENLD